MAYHDANQNGRMDMVLGFLPREGFAFSGAAGGPPAFEQASFEYPGGAAEVTGEMDHLPFL